jgi:hypothetical protein
MEKLRSRKAEHERAARRRALLARLDRAAGEIEAGVSLRTADKLADRLDALEQEILRTRWEAAGSEREGHLERIEQLREAVIAAQVREHPVLSGMGHDLAALRKHWEGALAGASDRRALGTLRKRLGYLRETLGGVEDAEALAAPIRRRLDGLQERIERDLLGLPVVRLRLTEREPRGGLLDLDGLAWEAGAGLVGGGTATLPLGEANAVWIRAEGEVSVEAGAVRVTAGNGRVLVQTDDRRRTHPLGTAGGGTSLYLQFADPAHLLAGGVSAPLPAATPDRITLRADALLDLSAWSVPQE